MMDFSQAPLEQGQDFSPLPRGTLAMGKIKIKRDNFGNLVTHSTTEGSKATYLNVSVQIMGGQYDKRIIFGMIGLTNKDGSTEGWGEQGRGMIRAILEASGGFQNPAMMSISSWDDIENRTVYMRVGQDVSVYQGEKQIRNNIEAFLTPNPASSTHQDFITLTTGEAPQQTAKAPF